MLISVTVFGIIGSFNKRIRETKGMNVVGQYLKTNEDVGYVVLDVRDFVNQSVMAELKKINGTIKARVLY